MATCTLERPAKDVLKPLLRAYDIAVKTGLTRNGCIVPIRRPPHWLPLSNPLLELDAFANHHGGDALGGFPKFYQTIV